MAGAASGTPEAGPRRAAWPAPVEAAVVVSLFVAGIYRLVPLSKTPVIAHGVQDTIDRVLIFCGRYPGL